MMVEEKKKMMKIEMGLRRALSGRIHVRRLWLAIVGVGCFLLPCILLIGLMTNLDQSFSVLTVQSSTRTSVHTHAVEEEISGSYRSGTGKRTLSLDLKEEGHESQSSNMILPSVEKEKNKLTEDDQVIRLPFSNNELEIGKNSTNIGISDDDDTVLETSTKREENQEQTEPNETDDASAADDKLISVPSVYKHIQVQMNSTLAGIRGTEVPGVSVAKQDSNNLSAVNAVPVANFCDFSEYRSDTCFLQGDVRLISRSSTIIVPDSSQRTPLAWKIRPYVRKWESHIMSRIREFTVKASLNPEELPQCTVRHTAPAVVFSTGGYVGNYFHDFTDLLIPLFATSRRYQGEVQLLVTEFSYGWISKYRAILNQLSRYEIINLDRDRQVHCFPEVHAGLLSHKELGLDPAKTPNGHSVSDFRELLRSTYSLNRKSVTSISGRKPRLLIMLRKGSRSFVNKREIISMGRRVGFKVVAAGPEEARNLTRFAKAVNSCDVMMGVHGAGLTNMLFLPAGAALIQILPWGGLHYACWHDFGVPAPDMSIKYLEYDIKEKESSLINKYSRDDPVFRDPMSIHKRGFGAIYSVFLQDQRVKLDVRRFSGVLLEALKSIQ